MKERIYSPLYAFLRPYVRWASKRFFRRWKVFGLEHFPAEGRPVIIVSNHQNALMDPLMCCLTAPRQLHFLTRADVFKSKLFRGVVFALNMLPVYRRRDRIDDMVERNNKTFEVAIARLSKGAAIGIFPEGNHGAHKSLRPLKKGLAILLQQAGEGEKQLTEVDLVPAGVDYSNYDKARASLVVCYGKPFTVTEELFADLPQDRNEKQLQLLRHRKVMEKVEQHLSKEMLDLHPEEHYPLLRFAEAVALENEGYDNWPAVRDRIHRFRDEQEKEDLRSIEFVSKSAQLDRKMQDAQVDHEHWLLKDRTPAGGWLLTLLLLIPALPAFIWFALPWQATLALTRKIVKDPHFNSTFRLSFGMIFLPLFGVIFAILAFVFMKWEVALASTVGLYISGLIALTVSDRLMDHSKGQQGKVLAKKHPELYTHWRKLRTDLQNHLYQKQP
jgi:1-acyl-sn-glycerol-3-phosphate acyltransferase